MFSSGSYRPNHSYGAVPLAEEMGEIAEMRKRSKEREGFFSRMFFFLRRKKRLTGLDDDQDEQGRTS